MLGAHRIRVYDYAQQMQEVRASELNTEDAEKAQRVTEWLKCNLFIFSACSVALCAFSAPLCSNFFQQLGIDLIIFLLYLGKCLTKSASPHRSTVFSSPWLTRRAGQWCNG